jgi:hypothetical protein
MDVFLPVHLFVHELVGEMLCCFPSVIALRPEAWIAGLAFWWSYRAGVWARVGDVIHGFAKRLWVKQ